MKIFVLLPSGRIVDRTVVGENKIRQYAEELPTIIFLFNEETL